MDLSYNRVPETQVKVQHTCLPGSLAEPRRFERNKFVIHLRMSLTDQWSIWCKDTHSSLQIPRSVEHSLTCGGLGWCSTKKAQFRLTFTMWSNKVHKNQHRQFWTYPDCQLAKHVEEHSDPLPGHPLTQSSLCHRTEVFQPKAWNPNHGLYCTRNRGIKVRGQASSALASYPLGDSRLELGVVPQFCRGIFDCCDQPSHRSGILDGVYNRRRKGLEWTRSACTVHPDWEKKTRVQHTCVPRSQSLVQSKANVHLRMNLTNRELSKSKIWRTKTQEPLNITSDINLIVSMWRPNVPICLDQGSSGGDLRSFPESAGGHCFQTEVHKEKKHTTVFMPLKFTLPVLDWMIERLNKTQKNGGQQDQFRTYPHCQSARQVIKHEDPLPVKAILQNYPRHLLETFPPWLAVPTQSAQSAVKRKRSRVRSEVKRLQRGPQVSERLTIEIHRPLRACRQWCATSGPGAPPASGTAPYRCLVGRREGPLQGRRPSASAAWPCGQKGGNKKQQCWLSDNNYDEKYHATCSWEKKQDPIQNKNYAKMSYIIEGNFSWRKCQRKDVKDCN